MKTKDAIDVVRYCLQRMTPVHRRRLVRHINNGRKFLCGYDYQFWRLDGVACVEAVAVGLCKSPHENVGPNEEPHEWRELFDGMNAPYEAHGGRSHWVDAMQTLDSETLSMAVLTGCEVL